MSQQWTDRIVGARMAVDTAFEDRVSASEFSRQQWGLVMSATEFEIEGPETPETATLVANTEKLPAILGELDSIDDPGPMGADDSASDGVLASIAGALGLGGDEGATDYRSGAEQLTAAYASDLQDRLEQEGRWEEICGLAADADG